MAEEPIDHRYTSQPVCPHCGYQMRDAWEIDFGGAEGDAAVTCGSCDEDYMVYRMVEVTYSTERMDP